VSAVGAAAGVAAVGEAGQFVVLVFLNL